MRDDFQRMLVSIIIPAYNCTEYLERCINSVLSQTWKNIEVIIVEDGSTDGKTPILCDQLAKTDQRIRIIHQKNSGPTAARKKGVDVCTGDYVFFVDADDYIDEAIVECCVKDIQSSNADIVCFDYVKEANGTSKHQSGFAIKERYTIDKVQAIKCVLTMQWLDGNMWCKLYNKSALQDITFDERRHCDFVTMINIMKACSLISIIPVVGYYYNIENESRTRGKKCHPRITEYEEAALELYKYAQSNMPDIMIEAEYYYLFVLLYVNIKMEKDAELDRKDPNFREAKKKLRKEIRTYFSNRYNSWKGKIQYLLCYCNLFRICYILKERLE